MANSLHRITAAPAPAPLSTTYAPRGQAAPPRPPSPDYIPPMNPPPATSRWHSSLGPTQSPPVLPRPTREPEPPSCHERPPPHTTPRPGGSSHNAYRARARESSPPIRASARSSSAFLPPHAAALRPRLVSRPGEGEWPTRRILPTPTASRPLLWPPKPAPPAQQEALRSGHPPRLAITPPSAPRLQNDPTSHPGSQRSSPRTRTLGDTSLSPPSARCPPPPLPHSQSSSPYPSPQPHSFPAPPVPAESSTQQSPHLSPDFL
ncbi:uncharacterized protein [Eschrichtius robustus]|uniref:uncharacterized protein n=1 Tax=Eschrichtius robustus TaxID=9764 RepID=UPI0035C1C1BD